ncbi:MAG: transglutaminase domain-containing protein [Kiloniellaceae bacterium]
MTAPAEEQDGASAEGCEGTYRVVHTTKYRFEDEASSCTVEARLKTRELPHQQCLFHQLVVRPLATARREWTDTFGNRVTGFTVPEAHRTLEVTAINVVRTSPRSAPALDAAPPWEGVRRRIEDRAQRDDLEPFLGESPLVDPDAAAAEFARACFGPGRPVLAGARDLATRIHRELAYDPGSTTVATPAAEALRLRRGVCQDFAHLAIAGLRSLGLAARYVSGYLDTSALKGPNARPGGDASHAWFSVYVPDLGWVDVDPTNDRLAADGYVTLAWGRDYSDVAPLQGAVAGGGGRHTVSVSVDVGRDEAVGA